MNAGILVPSLGGDGKLSLDALLNHPTALRNAITRLVESHTIIGDVFGTAAQGISGGGVTYGVLDGSNTGTLADIEERAPGAEYVILSGRELTDLAAVQDLGGSIEILDEHRRRQDVITVSNRITQLVNTLVRKLDSVAIAALNAAHTKYSVTPLPAPVKWSELVLAGDPTLVTPNLDRPTATFAHAQGAAATADDGIPSFDMLLVSHGDLAYLRAAYATELDDMLKSASLTIKATNAIPVGTAYLVARQASGAVLLEEPLTVRVVPQQERRADLVQAFVVPAIVVSRPRASVKITGVS